MRTARVLFRTLYESRQTATKDLVGYPHESNSKDFNDKGNGSSLKTTYYRVKAKSYSPARASTITSSSFINLDTEYSTPCMPTHTLNYLVKGNSTLKRDMYVL